MPLYNRPDEIRELLESLTLQTVKDFEVLVVEDGSDRDAREIVSSFADRLDVQYFWKENERQGFTRNFGFERAKGDWMVVFDSDCLIPARYFEHVVDFLDRHPDVDVYGGPDAAATAAAAQRAEADTASASEAEKSQDAVMGDLSSIDFRQSFKEAAKQLKIDVSSKSDQIPIPKLNAPLKLIGHNAMKEVEECTDLLEASMATTPG